MSTFHPLLHKVRVERHTVQPTTGNTLLTNSGAVTLNWNGTGGHTYSYPAFGSTDCMFSTSQRDRFTVKSAGIYLVCAALNTDSSPSGNNGEFRYISIRQNGAIASETCVGDCGGNNFQETIDTSCLIFCEVGDVLTVVAQQDSANNISMFLRTYFSAHQLESVTKDKLVGVTPGRLS